MNKYVAGWLLIFVSTVGFAQQITLDQCYEWARENHPLQAKTELLDKQSQLEQASVQAQKYPHLSLDAQATYQSDVVEFPLSMPGISVEPLDKDQYKANLTASQLIYQGGIINTQIALQKTQKEAQQKEVAIALHDLKIQVNTLYFNVLLLDQKKDILLKKADQLTAKKAEVLKLIQTGSTYAKAIEPIEIGVLELEQNIASLTYDRRQLWEQLKLLTGRDLPSNAELALPKTNEWKEAPRAELAAFDLRRKSVELQTELLKKQTLPRLSAFGTLGYGKPGLNILKNEWDDYYMAGVKLQWNVFDFQTNKKQRMATAVQKEIIDNQEQVFEWQQHLTADKYQSEMEKYNAILQSDESIVAYREKMLATAAKKLEHDLITTSEYIAVLNDLYTARVNQTAHKIQWALAYSNYNTTLYD